MSTIRADAAAWSWDEPWFPEAGVTKSDILYHYRRMLEVITPHLRDRPLAFEPWHPPGARSRPAERITGQRTAVVTPRRGVAAEVGVCPHGWAVLDAVRDGNVGVHTWAARLDRPDAPDRVVFDLDRSAEEPFSTVRDTALALRELLEAVNLVPFVMATGGRGLHVVAPLDRGSGTDTVVQFASDVAAALSQRLGGDVAVDARRNGWAQSSVCPYSVRPTPGATVAMPLRWEDLTRRRTSGAFTLEQARERVDAHGDVWATLTRHKRALREPSRRVRSLLGA